MTQAKANKQTEKRKTPEPDPPPPDTPEVQERKAKLDKDTADLMDEIDNLLGDEKQAQAFVEGYTQKGGQ
jgi:ubiquitin-like protein Pup